MICIPQESIDKVRDIVNRKGSTTITRQADLESLFGSKEFATEINKKYESSLLLKNQDTAMDKFLSNFSELGQKQKSELKAKIKDRLENRKDRIQNEELLSLAQDIWNKKYRIDIPLESIEKINKTKIEIDDLETKIAGTPDYSPERIAYGDKVIELKNTIEDIKYPQNKMGIKDSIKNSAREVKDRFSKEDGVRGNIGNAASLAGDVLLSVQYKALKASLDISYAFKQGLKVLTKSPKVWANSMSESLGVFKNIRSKAEMQAYADKWASGVVSKDMYKQMKDAKLAINIKEDFFPTSFAEKIPVIGNIFKASDLAFTIFSQESRIGLWESMMKKHSSVMTPKLAEDLAYVSNSITGRGSLGSWEANADKLNKIFFSARYIKSSVDTFTMPFNGSLSKVARNEAMDSSVRTIGTIGALMTTASLFTEVEIDPRSSKFGKMLIPGSEDRWVDLTGGIGSYITLAARAGLAGSNIAGLTEDIPEVKKSDGDLINLNTGEFGARTLYDVANDFATNKLAPAPSTLIQVAKGRNFEGETPTPASVAENLTVPISANNILDIMTSDDETIAKFIGSVADFSGASTTDYSKF